MRQKLRNIGQLALDLFFPQRCVWCGGVIGFSGKCACEKDLASIQLPSAPHNLRAANQNDAFLAGAWVCYQYKDPVKNAIWRLKYQDDQSLQQPLGEALFTQYTACNLAGYFDVLVPVPASNGTLRSRGYNQSALLGNYFSARTGLPVAENVLLKSRETQRQMSLGRQQRLANITGAFSVSQQFGAELQGKRILLIDDVITTGSTLNECAKMLLAAGAQSCCALCVAAVFPDGI